MAGEPNMALGTVTVADMRIMNLLLNKRALKRALSEEDIVRITGFPQSVVKDSLIRLYQDGRIGYKAERA